jgi:hypothetical protein
MVLGLCSGPLAYALLFLVTDNALPEQTVFKLLDRPGPPALPL